MTKKVSRELARRFSKEAVREVVSDHVVESVRFLDILAEGIVRDFRKGDHGGLEHIKDSSGAEAAYMALRVVEGLAGSGASDKAAEFCEEISRLVSR